ncbi:hypothetical protein LCGC14_1728760 [marine sediment metagenome]|uniref:Uncharacterized protein n=1 Tax=marine sediment metagenome TaxID=412755 RepID=A0A0F9K9X1_9ZZZZ
MVDPNIRLLYYIGLGATKSCGGKNDYEAMKVYYKYRHGYRLRLKQINCNSFVELMQIMIQDLMKKKEVESNEVG